MLPCVWFSNRSQKTSKCGKNISDTLGYRLVCHFFVLTTKSLCSIRLPNFFVNESRLHFGDSRNKDRILHGKCARTLFSHELWRIRNRTSERSERVRFLIQNNECVNTVQSTFHVVLCLLHTYWDWTPSLNYDKHYLNKCGQTTITEGKQPRKKRKSSNKIQNLWNKVGLSEFKAV